MSRPTSETVAPLLPRLKEDLARLVAIPSISEWGFPEHTRPALLEAHETVVALFRDAGVERFTSLELAGTAPVIAATRGSRWRCGHWRATSIRASTAAPLRTR